jgi:resuscitation-promoting factor RpfA
VRAFGFAVLAALMLAASGSAQDAHPSAAWLVQARCVHRLEGPWRANTGNGHFGGLQFSPQTWKRLHGSPEAAFLHPGDPAFPFLASPQEQLRRAWLLWVADGRSWRSWGAVGAACARASLAVMP